MQTTRMAAHAIIAGDGSAYLSLGAEMVSRVVEHNPEPTRAERNAAFSRHGSATARPARTRGDAGHLHLHGRDRRKVLASAGLRPSDIHLINEAFAAQVIPSYEEIGVPLDKVNVRGGAIALGHPFGMSGARITTTLLNSLRFGDKRIGVQTMCVAGGQGMAMVIERLA